MGEIIQLSTAEVKKAAGEDGIWNGRADAECHAECRSG